MTSSNVFTLLYLQETLLEPCLRIAIISGEFTLMASAYYSLLPKGMTATGYLKRNTAVDDLRHERCQHQIRFGVLENLSFEKIKYGVQHCVHLLPGQGSPGSI